MKPFPLFRLILAVLTTAGAPSLSAQDLPTNGLLLPPLPLREIAAVSPAPAETKAGRQPRTAPHLSHLTLPEIPVLAEPAEYAPTEQPSPEAPEPEVIPDEIPLSNPLLPQGNAAPSQDLLPSMEEFPGAAPSEVPSGESTPSATPNPEAADATAAVPGSDLSPSPQSSPEPADPNARGPIFRIRGAEAFALAREKGFRFTPAQGLGRRDGVHTVASQVPNVLTSEVHGTRMMQMRPSPLWTTPYIENTFYMFCDPSYNAVRLAPGWKIRGIQLKGADWQWVACPRSGANTASFSIRIRSWKLPNAPAQGTVVMLHGLTLEGPPGATNWKAAFPDLNRPAAVAAQR